jgi:hypothetical protein
MEVPWWRRGRMFTLTAVSMIGGTTCMLIEIAESEVGALRTQAAEDETENGECTTHDREMELTNL